MVESLEESDPNTLPRIPIHNRSRRFNADQWRKRGGGTNRSEAAPEPLGRAREAVCLRTHLILHPVICHHTSAQQSAHGTQNGGKRRKEGRRTGTREMAADTVSAVVICLYSCALDIDAGGEATSTLLFKPAFALRPITNEAQEAIEKR
jgi:hypothetical protein